MKKRRQKTHIFPLILASLLVVAGACILSYLLFLYPHGAGEENAGFEGTEHPAFAADPVDPDPIAQPISVPEAQPAGPTLSAQEFSGGLVSTPEPVFEDYEIHLMMVGDNLFHSGLISEGIQADGSRNYDFEFEGIMQDLIAAADIRIINQESPLGGNDREFTSYPVFNTPTEVGDATARAGFNVVIAATNHARDAGQSGVIHMANFYAENYPEILVCGIHGTAPQTTLLKLETEDGARNRDYRIWKAAVDAGVDESLAAALLPYHPKYALGTIDYKIEMLLYEQTRTDAERALAEALGRDGAEELGESAGDVPSYDPAEAITTAYGDSSPSRIPMVEVDGYKFAILNYTYSINWESWPADAEGYIERLNPYGANRMLDFETLDSQVLADIALAQEIADIVIVCPHWGIEYTFTPIARQVRFANQMIDAGADLILGAHPHVIEPVEQITTDAGNTGLCYYSVGNYISTQDHPERVLEMMAWVTFTASEDGIQINQEKSGGLPLVNHYTKNNGFTHRIYALEDYTEELANAHGMRYHGAGGIVRLSDLQTWAAQVIGDRTLTKQDILGPAAAADETGASGSEAELP